MEDNRLATEVLREAKAQSKRRDIIIIVFLIIFFLNNLAWIIAWNLPTEERQTTTESYDLQGEDSANVFYNSEGEVTINGTDQGNENNNESNTQEQTTK